MIFKEMKGGAVELNLGIRPAAQAYAGKDVTGPWRSSDHDPMLLGFDL